MTHARLAVCVIGLPDEATCCSRLDDCGRPVVSDVARATEDDTGDRREIDAAFASLVESRAGALVISADPFFSNHLDQRAAQAARFAVPAMFTWREFRDGWRLDQLWSEPNGYLAPGRQLRWEDPQRRQARRPAGRAAHQIRVGDQYEDSQGTRPDHPAVDPRAC